jgi:hypothetical protein
MKYSSADSLTGDWRANAIHEQAARFSPVMVGTGKLYEKIPRINDLADFFSRCHDIEPQRVILVVADRLHKFIIEQNGDVRALNFRVILFYFQKILYVGVTAVQTYQRAARLLLAPMTLPAASKISMKLTEPVEVFAALYTRAPLGRSLDRETPHPPP